MEWFGHVRREGEEEVLEIVEGMDVPGRRLVGRLRKTWKLTVQEDLKRAAVIWVC